MAKVTFQDEQGQNLNRYKLTPVDGQTNTYDLERVGTITQQGTPYNKEVMDHMLQAEDKGIAGGVANYDDTVQSATLGGNAIPKSGTTLQLPAYPTSLPANGGNASYATTAGSAPAAGGWANTANYPTRAVGLADFGLRGNYISNVAPSGGSDGDTWDQY